MALLHSDDGRNATHVVCASSVRTTRHAVESCRMRCPKFEPIRLSRRAEPFDSSDFIYEIKHDGFRAFASVKAGECQLISRNGNVFPGFRELSECIGQRFKVDAVLDGEIVVLDEYGRSQFDDLLFRRGVLYFYAFDLLFLDGEDLRPLPLVERKTRLRKLIRRGRSRLLYVDHIEREGCELFKRIYELDLEGIVAKRACSSTSNCPARVGSNGRPGPRRGIIL